MLTLALGPEFRSTGTGFFGGVGLVDGVVFGGAGLGGAALCLKVGGSGLFGLKEDTKFNSHGHPLNHYVYRSGSFLTMLLLVLVFVAVDPFMGLLPVYSLASFAVCLRKETTMES